MSIRVIFQALVVVSATFGNAWAQSAQPPVRYALLSAVGDQLTVVYAKLQTGSRLDRNQRDIAALPDNTLDRLVLRNLDAAFKGTQAGGEVAALAAANASLFSVQREALMGAKPTDAVVRAFAAALPAGGADRLLMVLKHRSEARIPVYNGTLGLGRLEGVGFYVDAVTPLKSADTGYIGTGFLAPFAYVRLVLADADGRVIAERRIEAAESFSMGDSRDALQPWEVLDAQAKVNILDRLLKGEIERVLPGLLGSK
ncbi:MAG: hypothetical protein ABI580_13520 [Burkholderiaceae bacterium]